MMLFLVVLLVVDEIKLAFGRTDDDTEKTAHETLITNAKAWAKEILL